MQRQLHSKNHLDDETQQSHDEAVHKQLAHTSRLSATGCPWLDHKVSNHSHQLQRQTHATSPTNSMSVIWFKLAVLIHYRLQEITTEAVTQKLSRLGVPNNSSMDWITNTPQATSQAPSQALMSFPAHSLLYLHHSNHQTPRCLGICTSPLDSIHTGADMPCRLLLLLLLLLPLHL
jgi:hypothetical protein